VASHRSGETKDTFIADFAYGVGAHGIKAGGLGQRERLEKYERLLVIEHEARL
jgi:enolase